MKVIVCGAGQVGFNIAKHLSEQNNDVTVIDSSYKLIKKINDSLNVQGIVGHASDPSILAQADANNTELLVAVTQSDEVNMVACQVARSLFNISTNIARIRNQSYLKPMWADLFTRDNMPVDVIISPEIEVAEALCRRIEVPGVFNMIPLVDDKVRVLGLKLSEQCPVIDTPLRQLTELFPTLSTTVLAVVRDEKIFVPKSDDHLEAGDLIYTAVARENTDRTMKVFGHEEEEAAKVVIVGGGNVGLNLAVLLEERHPQISIKLIEINEDRANEAAEKLNRTIILRGDALDRDMLIEASIASAGTIVAVADDDEVNILSSLLAKREGCTRAITLINNPIYGPLLGSLGIDVTLDPRETTVSTILRHIRKGRIRDLHSIQNGKAEIIEAEVLDSSDLVGKSIGDLKSLAHVRVGMIVRGDVALTPKTSTTFEAGDRVVMLTLADAVKQVEQMFSARVEFF